MKHTLRFIQIIFTIWMLIVPMTFGQSPAPSLSMILNHAGGDSVSISLKFLNSNMTWSCMGVMAAVAYNPEHLVPYVKGGRPPIHGKYFQSQGWSDYSNMFLEFDGANPDLAGYAEVPSGSTGVNISANAQFILCRMNFEPQGGNGVTSFYYYGNTGASGQTGYMWSNDPDMRAFASVSGLPIVYYPVELSTFSGRLDGNNIILTWTTVNETNNSHFEIERRYSFDQKNFSDWKIIDKINGNGTTFKQHEYMTIDYEVHPVGLYQYRLQQVDYDGSTNYSNIVEVAIPSSPVPFELYQNYPNPFKHDEKTLIQWSIDNDDEINSSTSITHSSLTTLKVFDLLGREITTLVNKIQSSGNYSEYFSCSSCLPGIYIYQLRHGLFYKSKLMIIQP